MVYGVKADATATFTLNTTSTLNNLSIALAFSDNKKMFNINALLAYSSDCVPGVKVPTTAACCW